MEFADYKAYTPGDDIRYIDWNVYGRLDTYVTKLFGAEEKKRTNILLDASSSMGIGNKFIFTICHLLFLELSLFLRSSLELYNLCNPN